jgi:putative FmdB family regulatory protein
MPLYEYECDACGHRFEKIQKFSDPLVDKCPVCGSHVHKLFSSPAIQFKGSGFYITDYPKGDKGSAPKSDGGKADKAAKAGKPEAAASSEKSEKSDKADSSSKSEKGSASGGSSSDSSAASTSTSTPSASSTPAASSTPSKSE